MQKAIKNIVTLLLLLLVNQFCFAQVDADSLIKEIKLLPNDTASIHKILEFGKKVELTDFKLPLDIYKLAEKKYGDDKKDSTTAVIFGCIAQGYSWLDNASEAINYFLKTKDIGERLNQNGFIATGYSGIALIYHLNKDFTTALENYEKAMLYYTNDYAESKKYSVANVGNMGYAYYQISQTIDTNIKANRALYISTLQKAILYNKKSLDIAKQSKADSIGMAKATINICLEYVALSKLDSAQHYYDFSSKLLLHVKDQDAHCEHYYNKGQIAFFKKDYKTALAAYNSSLQTAKKFHTKNIFMKTITVFIYAISN